MATFPARSPTPDWRAAVSRVQQWWRAAPSAWRWRQAGAAGVGILLAAGIGWWALRPHYAPLYTGLSPAAAGQMTTVLSQLKIPYRLADGGSAIAVPAGSVDQARVDLAQHNLPASGTATLPTSPLLSLGQTPQQTALAAQSALEQTLDQTLTGLAGVSQAHVLITEPPAALFGESGTPATASVFLDLTPGTSLSASQVTAVQHLVAAAVSGLTADHVTVVDQAGTFLSAPTPTLGGSGSATVAWQTTLAVDTSLDSRLTTMLDQIFGPGAAVVRTAAVLDLQSQTQHATVVAPKGTVTAQQTSTQTTTAPTGKAAGTATNVPTYPTGSATSGPSSSSSAIQRYATSTTVTNTVTPPGSVQRVSVAVALNARLSPAQQRTITRLVQAAIGAATPTVVTVTGIPFNTRAAQAAQAAMAAAAGRQQLIGGIRDAALVMAGLLLVLWIRRRLRAPVFLPGNDVPPVLATPSAAAALTPNSPVAEWYQRDPDAFARAVRALIEGEDPRGDTGSAE